MDLTFLDILLSSTNIFFNLGICSRHLRFTSALHAGTDYGPLARFWAVLTPSICWVRLQGTTVAFTHNIEITQNSTNRMMKILQLKMYRRKCLPQSLSQTQIFQTTSPAHPWLWAWLYEIFPPCKSVEWWNPLLFCITGLVWWRGSGGIITLNNTCRHEGEIIRMIKMLLWWEWFMMIKISF